MHLLCLTPTNVWVTTLCTIIFFTFTTKCGGGKRPNQRFEVVEIRLLPENLRSARDWVCYSASIIIIGDRAVCGEYHVVLLYRITPEFHTWSEDESDFEVACPDAQYASGMASAGLVKDLTGLAPPWQHIDWQTGDIDDVSTGSSEEYQVLLPFITPPFCPSPPPCQFCCIARSPHFVPARQTLMRQT